MRQPYSIGRLMIKIQFKFEGNLTRPDKLLDRQTLTSLPPLSLKTNDVFFVFHIITNTHLYISLLIKLELCKKQTYSSRSCNKSKDYIYHEYSSVHLWHVHNTFSFYVQEKHAWFCAPELLIMGHLTRYLVLILTDTVNGSYLEQIRIQKRPLYIVTYRNTTIKSSILDRKKYNHNWWDLVYPITPVCLIK